MFNTTAEMISLFLTFPTIILAMGVVYIWGKEAIKIFGRGPANPMEWLIAGVVIAFVGSVFDNAYWGIVWTIDYYSGDIHEGLARFGVFMNVIFRQTCGILAAYCHLKSYTELKKDSILNKKLFLSSSLVGLVYVTLLSLFKR